MGKGKFKYDVVKGSSVGAYEELPKYFLADTPEEAEELYKDYYTLLNNLSYTYSISTKIDKSDLFGEALIGLARANRDFDSKRSENFKTFAIYKIKGALNEYVRKNSGAVVMPAYVRSANRHITSLKDIFEMYNLELKHLYKAFEIGEIDMSWANDCPLKDKILDLFNKVVKAAERAQITMKELVSRAEYAPVNVRYDDYADADEIVQQKEHRLEMALTIEKFKKHLTPVEISICEGIMEDRSYEEIAKQFNRTAPWINYKLSKMKEKLEEQIGR